jgi:hypothetical protein
LPSAAVPTGRPIAGAWKGTWPGGGGGGDFDMNFALATWKVALELQVAIAVVSGSGAAPRNFKIPSSTEPNRRLMMSST